MSDQHLTLLERATAIAERDLLRPFLCTRRDTSEPIWLVQSRRDPSRYYLLTTSGDTIHCACPQAAHHGICAHAAAVCLALQAEPQPPVASACPPHTQSPAHQALRQDPRWDAQREQERQRRAEATRRERALLWTDDRPFSIWK
jgi:hypothetical protein